MRQRISKLRLASAALGGLTLLVLPATSHAQRTVSVLVGAPAESAPAAGSIHGVVRDDKGVPIEGAVVSAVGAATTVAVTERDGSFQLPALGPGPYVVRAYHVGHVAAQVGVVRVWPGVAVISGLTLRRADAPRVVVAAGFGAGSVSDASEVVETQESTDDAATAPAEAPGDDDHSEKAWRLRHARRSVLKETTIPDAIVAETDPAESGVFELLGEAIGAPARLATSLFSDIPFSGQLNFLSASSFDGPRDLFSADNTSRGITYIRLGAPVGSYADWTVRGAVTQADISAWIVAGSYSARPEAEHQYDLGVSYSTQRYDGGNLLALRELADGSRNVGTVYGYSTVLLAPALSVTYGGQYARYDYLEDRGLYSPRVEMTVTPGDGLRVSARVSRQARAPGAEEFQPPDDAGIWLPPQRTFSSIEPGRAMEAGRASHVALEIERDIAASTIAFRAFRQQVDDQLVTMFGAEVPAQSGAKLGHYLVGNAGDTNTLGYTVAFSTTWGARVHSSVAYSTAQTEFMPAAGGSHYVVLIAPLATTSEHARIHDVAATIEADVEETATRVLVLYRASNAFARTWEGGRVDQSGFGGRFDVQVRQSLPFLDFSSAKLEMLLSVRNFFRDFAADQSLHDELLAVSPPKRVVGGVTLLF